MNSEQQQLYNRIKDFSFDKPDTNFTFSQRLARENGWNIEYTKRVIEEYRKFVFLAVATEHIVTPSEQIDQVWHLHLTYTNSYWNEFCSNVIEKLLHHQPTEGGSSEQIKYDNLYRQTIDSYTQFFKEKPPSDIWSSPEKRFGEDLAVKKINTEQNWIIPKPNILLVINNLSNKIKFFYEKTATTIISIILGLIILLGTSLPGLTSNAPFYWDFINVTLDLKDNGDLLVTEKQKYIFKGEHSPEHYRFIRLDEVSEIKDVQVFEDNHILPIETKIKNNQFWIKWQEYLNDTNTHEFTLRYRAIGAATNSYGKAVLNWKAIFPKRDASIKHSEIIVNLPDSLAGKVNNYYTVGGNFSSSLIENKTIKFNSLKTLIPGQSSVVKVIFSGKFLNLNSNSLSDSDGAVLFLILLFGGFLMMLFIAMILGTSSDNISNKSKYRSNDSSSGGCGGCGGCGGGCGGCGGGG